MQITLKPVGYLSTFFKDYLKAGSKEVQLYIEDDHITIEQLLKQYKFDFSKIGLLILNEKIAKLDTDLKDGDRLVIMPMLAGG